MDNQTPEFSKRFNKTDPLYLPSTTDDFISDMWGSGFCPAEAVDMANRSENEEIRLISLDMILEVYNMWDAQYALDMEKIEKNNKKKDNMKWTYNEKLFAVCSDDGDIVSTTGGSSTKPKLMVYPTLLQAERGYYHSRTKQRSDYDDLYIKIIYNNNKGIK